MAQKFNGCLLLKAVRFGQSLTYFQKRFRYYRKPLKFIDEEFQKAKTLNPLTKCEGGDIVPEGVVDPFEREKRQCVACKYRLNFDYKNGRLLSQFLSSFSGRLYDKHQTGLCDHQQQQLRKAVFLARKAAIIPVFGKDGHFLKDPKLFDPMRPARPNPFT